MVCPARALARPGSRPGRSRPEAQLGSAESIFHLMDQRPAEPRCVCDTAPMWGFCISVKLVSGGAEGRIWGWRPRRS